MEIRTLYEDSQFDEIIRYCKNWEEREYASMGKTGGEIASSSNGIYYDRHPSTEFRLIWQFNLLKSVATVCHTLFTLASVFSFFPIFAVWDRGTQRRIDWGSAGSCGRWRMFEEQRELEESEALK